MLNLGGPVTLSHVEPFLKTLFGDRDLIKLPGPAWFQPTYAWGIAKIRTKGAQKKYAEIGGGSPLLRETARQASALRTELRTLGFEGPIKLIFRTSQPRAESMLRVLQGEGVAQILPLSLYPHNCKATTGSSIRELERLAPRFGISLLPGVLHYADHPKYIGALSRLIREKLEELPYATVIFSAHSLPVNQIENGDPYESEIHKSVEAIQQSLGDIPGGYTLGYQSRVGPIRWLTPSLKTVLKDCQGRDVIVVPISFVSEHIETLHELDIEYREIAEKIGIRNYARVQTVGISKEYIHCLSDLVIQNLK
jgi:ferrochelatase